MRLKLLPLFLTLSLLLGGCGTSTVSSSNASMEASSASSAESSSMTEPAIQPESASKTSIPAAITQTVSGVTVSVNPMIEMLSVIQYLSDYEEQFSLMTKEKSSYHDDLEDAFRQFESHEAVAFFNDAMQQGFSFDSPPTACLYLDDTFLIRPEFEGSDYQRNRLSADMEEFRNVMERFYLDTNFKEFFNEHQDFYNRMIDTYVKNFPEWNMIEAMESYYGKEMAGYDIILVPLFHPGGFGPSLEFEDGMHVYSVQGPYLAEEDTPLFGDRDDIANLVVHEFGHSFVPVNEKDNPVMTAEIKRSEYLMKPIEEDMTRNAYGNWTSAYEELVLRAAVIEIMRENTNVDLETLIQPDRDKGFIYIDKAYETIKQYAQSREQYPVFDDFVPVITDALLSAYPDNQAST